MAVTELTAPVSCPKVTPLFTLSHLIRFFKVHMGCNPHRNSWVLVDSFAYHRLALDWYVNLGVFKSRIAIAEGEEMTLLVADDDQNYRSLLSEILALQGHLVYTAADGAEAYQIIQTEEIQMVVSDIRMPRVDGFELHRLLRRDSRHCFLPFVYYSGYVDTSANNVIQDPDIDFFLPKGESISSLSQLISSEAAKQAGKSSSSPFSSDQKMRRGTDGLFPLLDF